MDANFMSSVFKYTFRIASLTKVKFWRNHFQKINRNIHVFYAFPFSWYLHCLRTKLKATKHRYNYTNAYQVLVIVEYLISVRWIYARKMFKFYRSETEKGNERTDGILIMPIATWDQPQYPLVFTSCSVLFLFRFLFL